MFRVVPAPRMRGCRCSRAQERRGRAEIETARGPRGRRRWACCGGERGICWQRSPARRCCSPAGSWRALPTVTREYLGDGGGGHVLPVVPVSFPHLITCSAVVHTCCPVFDARSNVAVILQIVLMFGRRTLALGLKKTG